MTSRASPRMAYVQDVAPRRHGQGDLRRSLPRPDHLRVALPGRGARCVDHLGQRHVAARAVAFIRGAADGAAPHGVEWRVSTFFKYLQDTPVQVFTPGGGRACGVGINACIQYRNSSRHQSVTGAEFDLRLRQGDPGDAYASLVLQRGRGEGGDLTSSPRRLLKAGISRELPWPGADAALEAQYISSVRGLVGGEAGARSDRIRCSMPRSTRPVWATAGAPRCASTICSTASTAPWPRASCSRCSGCRPTGALLAVQLQRDF